MYRVRDYIVKVPVPIGGGNMSAILLNRGDRVPDGVPEESIAWMLKRNMIEEIPDDPATDVEIPDDPATDVEIPDDPATDVEIYSFDPLGQKVVDVIAHLKTADDAEIARVIEIEKTADKPRASIISFAQ